jgi:preprotein translocase subunit Sec63
MASYTYDETGNMALFFIITVLFMILVPVTLSQISSSQGTCGAPRICLRHSLTRSPFQEVRYPQLHASALPVSISVFESESVRRVLSFTLISTKSAFQSLYALPASD